MKKLLVLRPVCLGLAGLLYLPAGADDTVTASVTPLVLSVSVNPTIVDYGTRALSNTNLDRTRAKSATITATNNGSQADFLIRGTDATPQNVNDTTWALNCDDDVSGTVGQDQFVHRFKVGDQPDFDQAGAHTLCTLNNGDSKDLAGPIASGGNTQFTLEIAMPTDTTGVSLRSTTVTVIAAAP